MFEDLNWDAFLSAIKNSDADSTIGSCSSPEIKKEDIIDSDVRDIVDKILNSNDISEN